MDREPKPQTWLARADGALGRRAKAWSRPGFYRFLLYLQPYSLLAAAVLTVVGWAVYMLGADEREQQAIREAWLVVNSATDGKGSRGRRDALEFLATKRQSLDGITVARADLSGIHLEGADLRGAIICDSRMHGAHLQGADLSGADLRRSDFTNADFRGAQFDELTTLAGSVVSGATGLDSELAQAAVAKGLPSCCDAGKISTHPCGF